MSVAGKMVSLAQYRHRGIEAAGFPGHERGGSKATEFRWCLGGGRGGGQCQGRALSARQCQAENGLAELFPAPSSGEKLGVLQACQHFV